MVEVTLIGAEGAGKTEVATAVADAIGGVVLRHPASILADMDVATGQFGNYIVNMEIALLRHHEQRQLRFAEQSFVSDGSIIETIAHAGIRVELRQPDKGALAQAETVRDMHAITALVAMMIDTLPLDHLYYLPSEGERGSFPARVDAIVRDVIDMYSVPVKWISGPDQAEQIIASIKETK